MGFGIGGPCPRMARTQSKHHQARHSQIAGTIATQLNQVVPLIGNSIARDTGDDQLQDYLQRDHRRDHAGNLVHRILIVQKEIG